MKKKQLLGFVALAITLLLAACAGIPKASNTYIVARSAPDPYSLFVWAAPVYDPSIRVM